MGGRARSAAERGERARAAAKRRWGPGRCVAARAAAPTLSSTTAQLSECGSGADGGLRSAAGEPPPLPAPRRRGQTYLRTPGSPGPPRSATSQPAKSCRAGLFLPAGGAPIVAGPRTVDVCAPEYAWQGRCGACSAHALLTRGNERRRAGPRCSQITRPGRHSPLGRKPGAPAPRGASRARQALFPRPRRQPCDPQALDQGQVRCLGRPGRGAGTSAAAATAVGALPA